MEDFRSSPDKPSIRVRTNDDMVEVIETRPMPNGDFDQSIRMFGPFKSADEERDFIRSIYRDVVTDPALLTRLLDAVAKWKRVDEP